MPPHPCAAQPQPPGPGGRGGRQVATSREDASVPRSLTAPYRPRGCRIPEPPAPAPTRLPPQGQGPGLQQLAVQTGHWFAGTRVSSARCPKTRTQSTDIRATSVWGEHLEGAGGRVTMARTAGFCSRPSNHPPPGGTRPAHLQGLGAHSSGSQRESGALLGSNRVHPPGGFRNGPGARPPSRVFLRPC